MTIKPNNLSANSTPNNELFKFNKKDNETKGIEKRISLQIDQLNEVKANLNKISDPNESKILAKKLEMKGRHLKKCTKFYNEFCNQAIQSLEMMNKLYTDKSKSNQLTNQQFIDALDASQKNMDNMATNPDLYNKIISSFMDLIDNQKQSMNNRIQKVKNKDTQELLKNSYDDMFKIAKLTLINNFIFSEDTIDSIHKQNDVLLVLNDEKYQLMKSVNENNYNRWEDNSQWRAIAINVFLCALGSVIGAVAGTLIAAALGLGSVLAAGTAITAVGAAIGGAIPAIQSIKKEFTSEKKAEHLMNELESMQQSWRGRDIILGRDNNQNIGDVSNIITFDNTISLLKENERSNFKPVSGSILEQLTAKYRENLNQDSNRNL